MIKPPSKRRVARQITRRVEASVRLAARARTNETRDPPQVRSATVSAVECHEREIGFCLNSQSSSLWPRPLTNQMGHSRAVGVVPGCVTVVLLTSLLANPANFVVIFAY